MPNIDKTQDRKHKNQSAAQLIAAGFSRIERDDRLLDVFSKETPDKGVELWEKWDTDIVEIVRIHNHTSRRFHYSRTQIEDALQENSALELKYSE